MLLINNKQNKINIRNNLFYALINHDNKYYNIEAMVNAVMTRSMTNKINKQKKHKIMIDSQSESESDNDSENETEQKHIQTDVAVDDMHERRQLRYHLLNKIFNKQNFNAIFNFDKCPILQETDEELRLVIMYLNSDV